MRTTIVALLLLTSVSRAGTITPIAAVSRIESYENPDGPPATLLITDADPLGGMQIIDFRDKYGRGGPLTTGAYLFDTSGVLPGEVMIIRVFVSDVQLISSYDFAPDMVGLYSTAFASGPTLDESSFEAPGIAGLWGFYAKGYYSTPFEIDIPVDQSSLGGNWLGIWFRTDIPDSWGARNVIIDHVVLSVIPEPSSIVLGAIATLAVGLLARRYRYRRL